MASNHLHGKSPDPRPFIGGARVDPLTSATYPSVNPHDGSVVCDIPRCGAADVERAVETAAVAAADWRRTDLSTRIAIVERLADLVHAHRDELATLDCREMGMPITQALGDISEAAEEVRLLCSFAEDALRSDILVAEHGQSVANTRVPHGVVGLISPWNFPLFVALLKLAPAILAGNAVVLKPSEMAQLSVLRLGDLATEAGAPDGVVNILPGLGAEAGAALAGHPELDFISFTGSTATGRRIMAAAAGSKPTPVALELGGKCAHIITRSTDDPARLAPAIAASAFFNQGQLCVATSLILAEPGVAEHLIPAVEAEVKAFRIGDPADPETTHGPLVSRESADRIRQHVRSALKAGIVPAWPAKLDEGAYLGPMVMPNVPADAMLATTELFGPVLSIVEVDNLQQAIARVNGSPYGLKATAWVGTDAEAELAATELRAGSRLVLRNGRASTLSSGHASVEPQRSSGFGVEGGPEGLRAYTRASVLYRT